MEDRSTATKPANSPAPSTTNPNVRSPPAAGVRPLYSNIGKLNSNPREKEASSAPNQRQPPVRHQAWSTGKNPVTGRTNQPQNNLNTFINTLREGQRVNVTLNTKAEFEGTYETHDQSSLRLRLVSQKKLPNSADVANGAGKQQGQMSFQRKDITDIRAVPGNAPKSDGKIANGNKSKLQTDSMISGQRFGAERELQAWNGGSGPSLDMSLEKSSGSSRGWDQFKANEDLFGVKTDYDENIYTTTINRDAPDYQKKAAIADLKAREIERSAAVTQHVAEERVMDFVGGDDNEDEEDKYSGVRRQNVAPLANRENKYTPPARRAPTGQATVRGAPFDPAIIDSRIVGAPSPKPSATPKPEEASTPAPTQPTTEKPATPVAENTKEVKAEAKPAQPKPAETKTAVADAKPAEKDVSNIRTTVEATRALPSSKPLVTDQVEAKVLAHFKTFANQQRSQADKMRSSKAKQDKEVRLTELKKFAETFKLSTPVPSDLVSIIAKDPSKQAKIQEKALKNAEEVARAKEAAAHAAQKEKAAAAARDAQSSKPASEQPVSTPATTVPDTRTSSRPNAPLHSSSGGLPGRHPGPRSFNSQPHYGRFNGGNRPAPHMGPQGQATGHLSQRLRNHEQQKLQQHPHLGQHGPQDMRIPPTGPANNVDPTFGRRISGVPGPYHGGPPPKLNPNSHEFRPSAFAPAFSPAPLPSQGSSPRSSVNNIVEIPVVAPAPIIGARGQLIRRKTKAIDVKKCYILSNIETIQPPPGRNWDDNDKLKPSYDTLPTWRMRKDDEPEDSTMRLSYDQYFERLPRTGAAMATPNPGHVMPQMPHQHQLPFHLQHGAHGMAPRQSPHMPPMQMQGSQPGHVPHVSYNNPDDHRMMHSNSAQSFASPRMGQVPMAYPPGVNAQQQMPYGQPVMPQYMGAGAPPMAQYRSYSNNAQFMPQQPHHMGGPMMVQPQFMGNPNGMIAGVPPMYPGGHPQHFIPPGSVPPQPMVGASGYPNSPGRPAAPMMAHQGSHQGAHQQAYGMSPAMPYQQPTFTPQPPQGKFTGQRPQ